MTTKQATGVALKFFAIYLLFNLLVAIPSLLSLGFQIDGMSSILTGLIIPAGSILIGIIIIGFTWKISNTIIKKADTDDTPVTNDMGADDVVKLFLVCMGLFFALQGIFEFLHVYAVARSNAQYTTEGFRLDINFLIVPLFKIIIGSILIAKPKQWLKALRSIGEK